MGPKSYSDDYNSKIKTIIMLLLQKTCKYSPTFRHKETVAKNIFTES